MCYNKYHILIMAILITAIPIVSKAMDPDKEDEFSKKEALSEVVRFTSRPTEDNQYDEYNPAPGKRPPESLEKIERRSLKKTKSSSFISIVPKDEDGQIRNINIEHLPHYLAVLKEFEQGSNKLTDEKLKELKIDKKKHLRKLRNLREWGWLELNSKGQHGDHIITEKGREVLPIIAEETRKFLDDASKDHDFPSFCINDVPINRVSIYLTVLNGLSDGLPHHMKDIPIDNSRTTKNRIINEELVGKYNLIQKIGSGNATLYNITSEGLSAIQELKEKDAQLTASKQQSLVATDQILQEKPEQMKKHYQNFLSQLRDGISRNKNDIKTDLKERQTVEILRQLREINLVELEMQSKASKYKITQAGLQLLDHLEKDAAAKLERPDGKNNDAVKTILSIRSKKFWRNYLEILTNLNNKGARKKAAIIDGQASIYFLNKLKDLRLIEVEGGGNKIQYKITPLGQEAIPQIETAINNEIQE